MINNESYLLQIIGRIYKQGLIINVMFVLAFFSNFENNILGPKCFIFQIMKIKA